ncbi:hypothetical protein L1987_67063 [Smallanthus sonchifolius]|uniref:Uncharacterized protein n=1 Tax=Smallanthus sonchifolius TaxID=185202 RepID=A0ACB9BYU8_9ASTR|nr:hypothetical protein L1987_67063 [Smallanthus sonchifolius]
MTSRMLIKMYPIISSKKHAWLIFAGDQVFAYAMMSSGSAASGVTNLNRTGIKHSSLPNFCKPLHSFCDRVALSIAFAFFGCFLLAIQHQSKFSPCSKWKLLRHFYEASYDFTLAKAFQKSSYLIVYLNCGSSVVRHKSMAVNVMDWIVTQAIVENNTTALRDIVEQDEQVLERRIGNTTVLHLASKIGNAEMVSFILELRPDMVAELRNANPRSVSHGTREDFLLSHATWLLDVVDEAASLHVSATKGRTEIAKKLLEKCTDLANQKDRNGSLALHCACRSGELEISKMLLGMNPDHALQFDNDGYTPLHLAAVNGNLEILQEFASIAPFSILRLSKHGENVFHLTVRFKRSSRSCESQSIEVLEVERNASFGIEKEEPLIKANKNRPKREHIKIHREALQNARYTITVVAVLIVTVAFTAGINPPGGVYQDRPLVGKSIMGKKRAFKIFAISNHIALFVSMCTIVVLVSIIPFRKKPQKLILATAHKTIWVAISFMAVSYVAATWVVMPMPYNYQKHTITWTFEALLSICAGTLGFTFFGLLVMFIRHQLKKHKLRQLQLKVKNACEINLHNLSLSTISDINGFQNTERHKSMAVNVMDWMVTQAIVENNMTALRNIVEQDEQVLERRIGNTTALHLASKIGNAEMVSFILESRPEMVAAENSDISSIDNADAEIAKKLLEKCTDLANQKDINGSLALHCACRKGELEISKMLLGMNPDQALQFDNNGYTPLHLAAINGNVEILQEFASIAPFSFLLLSKHGENVFHLTFKEYIISETNELSNHQKDAQINAETDHLEVESQAIEEFEMERNASLGIEKEPQIKADKNRPKIEHIKIHRESQQNARNTITVDAVLIVTVAFTAGINPPGGVYQDGSNRQHYSYQKKATKADPRNRSQALLSICAGTFGFTFFGIIAWVVNMRAITWTFKALLPICAGTFGFIFFGLPVMFIRHPLKKQVETATVEGEICWQKKPS